MANIFKDNSLTIGGTPLVRLNRIVDGAQATVLGKVEGRNPAYSVKCRIGASMIWDAEQRGLLKPGVELIEATSGNTGIALAFVAAARGYKLTIAMPSNYSLERRRVLKMLGASLELTPEEDGMYGAVEHARQLVAENPERFLMLHQFENPANPRIHYETTGPEIWNDTDGAVDVLVSGIGTGGTLSGVSRYFKEARKQSLLSVGVEPECSPVIRQHLAGEEMRQGLTAIQGIGAGFIPDTLDLRMLDRIESVSDEAAIHYAQRLAKEEGLLCGISCGAAAAVACRLADAPEFAGKTIVAILPDAGERYLSGPLFSGIG